VGAVVVVVVVVLVALVVLVVLLFMEKSEASACGHGAFTPLVGGRVVVMVCGGCSIYLGMHIVDAL
jgi:hypothetical protein